MILVEGIGIWNEVRDLEGEHGRERSRDDVAVAVQGIRFEAEQAHASPGADDPSEIFERCLGVRRLHVLEKDRLHFGVSSCARCGAPNRWRTQRAKVEIIDPDLAHTGRELCFRKAGAARAGHCADVDEQLDAGVLQRVLEAARCGALISDCGE